MTNQIERILILAKTYPSPSARHVETSCVAGINEDGHMRRLFPVPFRLIEDGRQFKKWQWIDARVEKAAQDHRPESYRLFIDNLKCGATLRTDAGWSARMAWLAKIPTFTDFDELIDGHGLGGLSLALLKPHRVTSLEITASKNQSWTQEETDKLLQQAKQAELFSTGLRPAPSRTLKKVPFDFHYCYECATADGRAIYKHKIVDWEAAALFWNCYRDRGNWQVPFRAKLEKELPAKELMFLMGNMHRFQDQWLIVSLIYPPRPACSEGQSSLI